MSGYSGESGYSEGMGEGEGEPFEILEIRLVRRLSGFGFRIIGGREEGSQATIGDIVSGEAADLDGHLMVGDAVTHINGHSVLDASHRDVITLMDEAAAQGEVVLCIQRKMLIPESMPPLSSFSSPEVVIHKLFHQSMRAVPLGKEVDKPFPGIPQGVRDVIINRPNEQTSFGFVLQCNTLKPGCMICEFMRARVNSNK